MIKLIKRFCQKDIGAVTVDWVLITAAVVVLGVTGATVVNTKVETKSSSITL